MKLAVISFKECWKNRDGKWVSSGGFPIQMSGITSLFEESAIMVTEVQPRQGGILLPQDARIRAVRLPKGQNFRRKVDVLINLPYYLKEIVLLINSANVVHTPLPGDIPLLGFLYSILKNKLLIARYGGSWIRNSQNTPINDLIRLLMKIFAGGHRVMLVTGSGNGKLDKKLHWIFSTSLTRAELETIKPMIDRGISNPPRLVFIGRFSPEKGVPVLLRAIQLLHATNFHPMPECWLLGDGPDKKMLEDLVKNAGMTNLIYFFGQTDRSVLFQKLLSADICVQPSLTEGFSKAWLDAFACGLPVITTNVGAAQAVIGQQGERGWITSPGDVEGLADLLRMVLTKENNWPVLRARCRGFAESRTIEDWVYKIGNICANQWQVNFSGGKLGPCEM